MRVYETHQYVQSSLSTFLEYRVALRTASYSSTDVKSFKRVSVLRFLGLSAVKNGNLKMERIGSCLQCIQRLD